ncbi:glycosyltransferase family 2 protein [Rhodoferax sp.]|uniref:glycosyltransferase family 2 protein n=1 Tax=Rhodoferax sp. TaxID=50421 RepID=UPI00261DB8B5|nr:glycosyltransferase family 2 protein [Rhodoferax sp.]MDD3936001.1 glycosyltransferase family 2 protein [Rhodoferax sp.]
MTFCLNGANFDLSVIVVNYNTCHLFDEFFTSLDASSLTLSVQTLLVDNASTDTSRTLLHAMGAAISVTFNDVNVGFGRANNQAVPLVEGRYALLLNTDAFVAPNTLTKTLAWMDSHPDCGVLGVKLTDRAGALQPSCRYFPTPFNIFLNRTGLQRLFPWVVLVDDMTWDHASVRECDWVPGCYYLIRHEVLDKVGLFDPRFFMYYEEVDHCRRVKAAGWKVMFYPDTSVVHLAGESAKSAGVLSKARQISGLQVESELLYMRKHYGRFGLAWHMALVGLGDAVVGLKQLLKRALHRRVPGHFQPLFLSTWRALQATAWASQPTR